ncbi:tyrosine-type recombinase/integrase [Gemmatimonadota bacterium]
MQEFIGSYLEYAREARSPRAYELLSEIVPRVLKTCDWPPKPEELRKHWQILIDRGDIKAVTANRERRAVGVALSWGVKNGHLEENACAAVRKWREGDRGATIFFEPEEVVDILAHLPEKYHDLITWSIWTGMRLPESLSLQWEDILGEGDDRWHAVRIHTRGGRERIIPLVDDCSQILSRGRKKKLAAPFPFRSRRVVYQSWVRAKMKAEIEKGHFYTLRTTCAVWFLRSGATLAEVNQMLGHSSMAFTEQLFGEFVLDELEPPPELINGVSSPWEAVRILRERG